MLLSLHQNYKLAVIQCLLCIDTKLTNSYHISYVFKGFVI